MLIYRTSLKITFSTFSTFPTFPTFCLFGGDSVSHAVFPQIKNFGWFRLFFCVARLSAIPLPAETQIELQHYIINL